MFLDLFVLVGYLFLLMDLIVFQTMMVYSFKNSIRTLIVADAAVLAVYIITIFPRLIIFSF